MLEIFTLSVEIFRRLSGLPLVQDVEANELQFSSDNSAVLVLRCVIYSHPGLLPKTVGPQVQNHKEL